MRRSVVAFAVVILCTGLVAAAGAAPGSRIAWPSPYASSVDPGVAQFRPDGTLLVVNGIGIWNVQSWKLVHALNADADSSLGAHFSPDGTKVVTFGLGPADPRIWNVATGRTLGVLRGHTGGIGVEGNEAWTADAVFSADGTRVVTAGWDRTARIWDANSGRSLLVLRGHSDVVDTALFSPDGTRVATASEDRTVRIWDATTGRCLGVLRGGTTVFFSPDGKRLFTSSAAATTMWEPVSLRRVRTLAGHASTLSADGQLLPLGSRGQTRILDLSSDRIVRTVRGATLGFSPDGRHIATDTGWDKQHYSTVGIWDTATGRLLHTLRGRSQYELIETALFSPNGRLLLTDANRIQEVLIWKVATGRIVRAFR